MAKTGVIILLIVIIVSLIAFAYFLFSSRARSRGESKEEQNKAGWTGVIFVSAFILLILPYLYAMLTDSPMMDY